MRDAEGIPWTAGACGLPRRTWVAAAPAERDLTLFRAVSGAEITEKDFEPQTPEYANETEMAEIKRLGISHFTSVEKLRASGAWREDKTAVAVEIPADPRIHLALTGKAARGHVCVWAPEGFLATRARQLTDA